jgi:hypothetical protein
MSVASSFSRFRPTRGEFLAGALLVNTEVLLVLAYLSVADVTATAVMPYVYPFVWTNVSLWALVRVRAPDADRRRTLLAAGVGIAYFLLIGSVGGLFALSGSGSGFRLAWLPPGWGPAFLYEGSAFSVALVPYKTFGYAALAYLVSVAVLDAARGALSGMVGLFSCVSCTLPVVATVASSLFGASVAAQFATTQPYGISTVVFVLTVGLLVWRPTLRR